MNVNLKKSLIKIAKERINNDPSHDFLHALRVLELSEKIAEEEKGDLDIIIPSALFHDVIVYPKNHYKSAHSSTDSAKLTKLILEKQPAYPKEKILKTYKAIQVCSFTKGKTPNFLEAKILQDADSLEAVGAISIMRTFSSAGCMNRQFYDIKDPFCKNREPNDKLYALDLFYTRLLIVHKKLYTNTAKNIALKRVKFLKIFLKELKEELFYEAG